MRIIRGEHRGRKINPPKNFTARPTTDFAKEALFNILDNKINYEDCKVLDLFAGSGGISYEFASRGSTSILAVEMDRKHAEFINKTVKQLYPEKSPIRVIQADAFKFMKTALLDYDVIFADPPYENEDIESIPNLIFANEKLKEGSILILEHSKKQNFDKHQHFEEQRVYGSVHFSFFKK